MWIQTFVPDSGSQRDADTRSTSLTELLGRHLPGGVNVVLHAVFWTSVIRPYLKACTIRPLIASLEADRGLDSNDTVSPSFQVATLQIHVDGFSPICPCQQPHLPERSSANEVTAVRPPCDLLHAESIKS